MKYLLPRQNQLKYKEKITMFLDYLSTYPMAKFRYTAFDMVLHMNSDAAFLVPPKARSRLAGFSIVVTIMKIQQHRDQNSTGWYIYDAKL